MIPATGNFVSLFLMVLLLFSCQENRRDSTDRESQSEASQVDTAAINTKPEFIQDEGLVRKWNARLELISQNDDRFEVEKELRENRHVQGRLDTIKTLTYDGTVLRVHTTKNLYAVESAEIEDAGFPLQESVGVGMTKSELEEVLDTELTSDYIQVGNKLETFVFSFIFKNNNLEKIKFDGYVD